MTVPGTGPVGLSSDVATEFSDTAPHGMQEFYRGGSLVADTPANAAVPTSGQINLLSTRGASSVVDTGWMTATAQSYAIPSGTDFNWVNAWDGNYSTGWAWSNGVFLLQGFSTIGVWDPINASEVLEFGFRHKGSNGWSSGGFACTYLANDGTTNPPNEIIIGRGPGGALTEVSETSYFTVDETANPVHTDPVQARVYVSPTNYYYPYGAFNANDWVGTSPQLLNWLAAGPRGFQAGSDTNGSSGPTLWEMQIRVKYKPAP